MGLDMYLEARKYVSKGDWKEGELVPSPEFLKAASFGPDGLTKYSDFGSATVCIPVGYWRKANAIHGWFVREVQGGVDDCREAYVSRQQLVALRDACKSVVSVSVSGLGTGVYQRGAAAVGLLPTSGFFFGSTEMDEWYYADLKHTIEMIDHVLSLIPEDFWDWSFYYHSSW